MESFNSIPSPKSIHFFDLFLDMFLTYVSTIIFSLDAFAQFRRVDHIIFDKSSSSNDPNAEEEALMKELETLLKVIKRGTYIKA